MRNLQVLSKAEMDALTERANDESEKIKKNDIAQPRIIDFTNQIRIVRNEFPVLERIHERVCRKFSEYLYDLMSREINVSIELYKMIKQDEYLVSLKAPCLINTVRLSPLRGKALIVLDDSLVFLLVDNYFGGHGREIHELGEREFTSSEMRVIDNILKLLMSALKEAWKPIRDINIDLIKSEQNPHLLSFNQGNDDLLVTRLKCKFESSHGFLDLVIPHSMLEPIREQLDMGAVRSDDEFDPNWIRSLQEELYEVSMELHATLVEKEIKLSNILALKAGDVIPIEMQELVCLFVENIPRFFCKFGVSGEKCALQVVKKI